MAAIYRARCAKCGGERRCSDPGDFIDSHPVCDGCGYRVESGWERWEAFAERRWVAEVRGHGEKPAEWIRVNTYGGMHYGHDERAQGPGPTHLTRDFALLSVSRWTAWERRVRPVTTRTLRRVK